MDGKCPHGMLRVDSDEQGKKACDVRVKDGYRGYETTDDKDPRFCCLLSQTVDLKVTKLFDGVMDFNTHNAWGGGMLIIDQGLALID